MGIWMVTVHGYRPRMRSLIRRFLPQFGSITTFLGAGQPEICILISRRGARPDSGDRAPMLQAPVPWRRSALRRSSAEHRRRAQAHAMPPR
jgi:hypothetical protein